MSKFALDLLKAKGKDLTDWQRVCVLSFDEMSVDQRMSYDAKEDRIIGPHSKALVFMIRGLMEKWKLPIYYDFDVTPIALEI